MHCNAYRFVTECPCTFTIFSFDFKSPSLSMGNCLVAHQINWMYTIVLSNGSNSSKNTTEREFHLFEGLSKKGQYDVHITPVITDLGLSGAPFMTNIR